MSGKQINPALNTNKISNCVYIDCPLYRSVYVMVLHNP